MLLAPSSTMFVVSLISARVGHGCYSILNMCSCTNRLSCSVAVPNRHLWIFFLDKSQCQDHHEQIITNTQDPNYSYPYSQSTGINCTSSCQKEWNFLNVFAINTQEMTVAVNTVKHVGECKQWAWQNSLLQGSFSVHVITHDHSADCVWKECYLLVFFHGIHYCENDPYMYSVSEVEEKSKYAIHGSLSEQSSTTFL